MNLYEELVTKGQEIIGVELATSEGRYYMYPLARSDKWIGISGLEYLVVGDVSELYSIEFVKKIKEMLKIAINFESMGIGEISDKTFNVFKQAFNKEKKRDFEGIKMIDIYLFDDKKEVYNIYINNRSSKTEWGCHENFLEKVDINASDEELHEVFLRQYEKADGKIHKRTLPKK